MSIIYLGNMGRGIPTTVDTLTPSLRTLTTVRAASPYQNKILRLADMLMTALKAKKNDVVLIDTYSTLAFYYAWLCARVCKLKGVKYIPYLHGGNLPKRMDTNAKWLNKYFDHASLIITPSAYLKEAVEGRGYGPVRFIYNFIHLKNYPFQLRKNPRPRLLWVRSFHSLYNPEMALHVVAQLLQEFSDVQLCMVGPDKDGSTEKCKALAKSMNIERAVTFAGKLSKEEWISLSSDYDIFINTTNFDNMPVSVIEAMALGLVVISTNVGGIPYLLEDKKNGLLVDKNDTEAMVSAVKKLIEDPQVAQEISLEARKKAEEFDWNTIKESWLEVINEHA